MLQPAVLLLFEKSRTNNIMNAVKKIQKLLNSIDNNIINKTGKIFINAVKNEFIKLNGEIIIPKIHVKELDYDTAMGIIEDIINYIPEFLYEHCLLAERKPASEQHSLHFVKGIKGKTTDFIHIFKIDFKFGGDSNNIIEKGDSDNYPSYRTDRLYYKSRIIPVNNLYDNSNITDFDPIRLFETNYIESDKSLFTATIFDELNKNPISNEINKKIDFDIFKISQELYPFIAYDYFTACLNILYPIREELMKGADLFEPIFLLIYNKYNNIDYNDAILNNFKDSIKIDNTSFGFTDLFINKLSGYFNRFTMYRDDEMMLRGWRRIDISS